MRIQITITESITKEHIDSVLLDTKHKDTDLVLIGDYPVKNKLIEFSKLYSIPWEYYPITVKKQRTK